MAHTLWKTVWWFLAELNIVLLYDPAIMHLSIYLNELKITFTQKPAHGFWPPGAAWGYQCRSLSSSAAGPFLCAHPLSLASAIEAYPNTDKNLHKVIRELALLPF